MKKYFKIILALYLPVLIKAQSNAFVIQDVGCNPQNLPCEYNPSWNWLADPNNLNGNWDARLQSGTVPMGSPFFTSFVPVQDLVSINNTSDYLPEQGWVLLAKDFGCVPNKAVAAGIPWFMLYNKYRSIVRLFLWYGNPNNYNSSSIKLSWSNGLNNINSNNSLLTLSNKFAKPNISYPVNSNNELMLNYMNTVPNNGGWTVTEFIVNFDPNTINATGQFQFIQFDLSLVQNSNVTLSGEFTFNTQSATVKEAPAPAPNNNNPAILDYITSAKEFLGKIPKSSDVSAGFTSAVAATDTLNKLFHTQFTRNLNSTANNLNNGELKKVLVGTATIAEQIIAGKYLDVATSIIGLFVGKSNQAASTSVTDYIQPTISRGSIKFTGTIRGETNAKNIILQLPGTSHKFSNGNLNCSGLPIYDCPLGLVSLQRAPNIEMKKHSIFSGQRTYTVSTPLTNNPFNTTVLGQNIFEQFNSYKVVSDLEIALNGAVGVTIKSIKACLVAEQDESIQPIDSSYVLMSDRPNSKGTGKTGYNELTIPPSPSNLIGMNYFRLGYEQSFFTNKTYILNSLNKNTKTYSYSTPFVDIADFKNTVIMAQPAMRIYIKIQVVMLPTNLTDDQTPIVYSIPYDLTGKITDVGSSTPSQNGAPPALTCAQQVNTNTGTKLFSNTVVNQGVFNAHYISSYQNVLVNANDLTVNNVNFKAGINIKLTSGFTAKAVGNNFFKAEIVPNTGCAVGENALVLNTYFQNCTQSALDRKANFSNVFTPEKVLSELERFNLLIAPNPNNGNFKLIFNKLIQSASINITNNLGMIVSKIEFQDKNGISEYQILESLPQGSYILSFQCDLGQKFIKFVVN